MKEILKLIQQKGQEFAQLELFEFFQNTSIAVESKMLWVPYFVPFIMNFGELHKNVFRKEPADNKLQEIINEHTYEDEYHWKWFLKDIETLGLNKSIKFTDSLKFLWSEKTKYTRKIYEQILIHTGNAEPIIVLITIQCLEETFKIGLSKVVPVIEELKNMSNRKYYWFSETHTDVENNHYNSMDVQTYIQSIELTSEQINKSKEVVNLIFQLTTNSMNELMINTREQIKDARKL